MTGSAPPVDPSRGFAVPDWTPRSAPARASMQGRLCRLVPLDVDHHLEDLFQATCGPDAAKDWAHLPYGPFDTIDRYREWIEATCLGNDPLFFAIVDLTRAKAIGVASYLRIDQAHGVIEVGHINYAPQLQRTPLGTEAMFLMMAHVFDDLGYRRYEWKCNALNDRSKRAAQRYGFQFEGIFRQAMVTKGHNRDTAWFSIIDSEWPALKEAFQKWLAPDNFDADGHQKHALSAFMPD